ncbi:hypothetical protein FIU86_06210 [Roseovarius sp. THAF9]|nr:hypothetical protein FIU86_06210 [Roseovarius sp. THAF9]
MALSCALFYVVYALGINWLYNIVFSLPEWTGRAV